MVARLRENGQGTLADMLNSINFVPGHGIDFGKVGTVLLTVLALFLVAAVLGLLQGLLTTTIVQRARYARGDQAETKLARLPLGYFDRQPHGEVLSRVTNDIDNLA